MSHFNYLITVHNRERMIRDVLWGILLGAGPDSRIYVVLDGCTDDTEGVIDRFTSYYANVPLTKVYMSDTHETLSINAGLIAAIADGRMTEHGFNVILQDDVILADRDFESGILRLYRTMGARLGVVSLRYGANFCPDILDDTNPRLQLEDGIESAYGVGMSAEPLMPGQFAYRSMPIKSPICVSGNVLGDIGLLNPDFAPHTYDDTDLDIRAIQAGYFNGVFCTRWYSDVRWGGTRQNSEASMNAAADKNAALIRRLHPEALRQIVGRPQSKVVTQVIPSTEADRAYALKMWELSKKAIEVPIG
jgi:hypothetical protein